jgi:hypothetical protein
LIYLPTNSVLSLANYLLQDFRISRIIDGCLISSILLLFIPDLCIGSFNFIRPI